MLFSTPLLAATASLFLVLSPSPAAAAGTPTNSSSSSSPGPTLRPFIHINLLLDQPVNASTPDGFILHVPNRGGKITGNITGDIVPVGAANEFFPTSAQGSTSFYTNSWAITTSQGTTLNMDGRITVRYSSPVNLHGFGPIGFRTGDPRYRALNYDSFYAEIAGVVTDGVVAVDVFQVVSARG